MFSWGLFFLAMDQKPPKISDMDHCRTSFDDQRQTWAGIVAITHKFDHVKCGGKELLVVFFNLLVTEIAKMPLSALNTLLW